MMQVVRCLLILIGLLVALWGGYSATYGLSPNTIPNISFEIGPIAIGMVEVGGGVLFAVIGIVIMIVAAQFLKKTTIKKIKEEGFTYIIEQFTSLFK
jgi:hypothetical protein